MPSDNNYNFVSFVNTLILICMIKKKVIEVIEYINHT